MFSCWLAVILTRGNSRLVLGPKDHFPDLPCRSRSDPLLSLNASHTLTFEGKDANEALRFSGENERA